MGREALANKLNSKTVLNLDLERKKELDRRKKLRLLQVRQQSKDFAKYLRENVQAEEMNQRRKLLESKRKEIQKQKLEELKRLQDLFKTCLEDVGSSHREAAKQPNINLIKQTELAKSIAVAAERGAEAERLLKENQAVQRQKIEGPLITRQNTRNRENLRSCFVSALPKHSFRKKPRCLPKPANKVPLLNTQQQVLQNLPSNLPTQPKASQNDIAVKNSHSQINLEVANHNLGKQKFHHPCEERNTSVGSSFKDCSCDYVVCCCHNSPPELRRSRSESAISSDLNIEVPETQIKKCKTRSRSCSLHSVRTLNYCDVGNLYESSQQNFTRVTHHTSPPKRKERNNESVVKHLFPGKKASFNEELKKKTEERSLKAVQREQIKQDYLQLLQDLGNLSRKKAKNKPKAGVYQKAREVVEKKESKQKKLTAAFESLLHSSSQPSKTKSTEACPLPKLLSEDQPSPPSLNLALYQEANMHKNPTSQQNSVMQIRHCDEVTVSQSPPLPPRSDRGRSHRSRSPGGTPRSICPSEEPSHGRSSPGRSPRSQVTGSHQVPLYANEPGPSSQCTQRGQESHSRSPRTPCSQRSQGYQPPMYANVSGPSSLGVQKRQESLSRSPKSPCPQEVQQHQRPPSWRTQPCPPRDQNYHGSTSGGPSTQLQMTQDPSGDFQVNVKSKGHKKKCKKHQANNDFDSSTSYVSPPENLTPSEHMLLDALLIKVNSKAINKDLKKYIRKLLSMSRESIDDLDPSKAPDETIARECTKLKEDYALLANLIKEYVEVINTCAATLEEDCNCKKNYSASEQFYSPPSPAHYKSPPKNQMQQKQPTNYPFPQESLQGRHQKSRSRSPPCPDNQDVAQEVVDRRGQSPSRVPPHKKNQPDQPSQQPYMETPTGRYQARDQETSIPATSNNCRPRSQPMYGRQHSPDQLSQERSPRQAKSPCPQTSEEVPQRPHSPCPPPSLRDERSGRAQPTSPQQSPQRSMTQRPVQIQTPFGLSFNLLPDPREAFRHQEQCAPQDQRPQAPERSESPFDPYQNLPFVPDCETPILRPHYSFDWENFDDSVELERLGLNEQFAHLKNLGKNSRERSQPPLVDVLKSKHSPTNSSVFASAECSASSSVDDIECKQLKSPMNMCNISQRINDVSEELYDTLVMLLVEDDEEKMNHLRDCFYELEPFMEENQKEKVLKFLRKSRCSSQKRA